MVPLHLPLENENLSLNPTDGPNSSDRLCPPWAIPPVGRLPGYGSDRLSPFDYRLRGHTLAGSEGGEKEKDMVVLAPTYCWRLGSWVQCYDPNVTTLLPEGEVPKKGMERVLGMGELRSFGRSSLEDSEMEYRNFHEGEREARVEPSYFNIQHLKSLFASTTMSTSSFEHPQQFKAAVWPKENAQLLEIKNVEWRNPQHGPVVIKVHVAGINSTDNISRYNLIGKIDYPTTPGSNVVGEIVQVGQGVKHLKQGQHVVGILGHHGRGEYCIIDEQFIRQLNDKQKSREEIVVQAFEGARIEGSLRRFERGMGHEDQQHAQEINKRMGFDGSGVCVVYGEGYVLPSVTTVTLLETYVGG
ncbi:hypothetical protein JCM5353_006397 [Sporobolomyces roseus]